MGVFTIAGMGQQARRYVAVVLAIMLGVGFVTASLALGDSMLASVRQQVAGEVGQYDVVVQSPVDFRGAGQRRAPEPGDIPKVRAIPGADVHPVLYSPFSSQELYGELRTLPSEGSLALTSGSWPSAPDQALIGQSLARQADLSVGDVLHVPTTGDHKTPLDLKVTGIVETKVARLTSVTGNVAFVQEQTLLRREPTPPVDLIGVDAKPGTSPDALLAQVQAALPGADVVTGADAVDQRVSQVAGDADALRNLLLVFAGISLVTSMIVIANTFSVLVAQRTRELALARCVGATKGQVWRSVLQETGVVAVVASALGVVFGLGLTWLLMLWSRGSDIGLPLTTVSAAPATIAIPLVVGIVVTLISALVPARNATKVPALAALRPEPAGFGMRANVVRVVFGCLFFFGGVALMLLGAFSDAELDDRVTPLLMAIGGGFLAVVGGLMLAVLYVPAFARVIGWLPAKVMGVPGDLAVVNVRRNPKRAAATASALLIGMGLMSMMAVGTSTIGSTLVDQLNATLPVDMALQETQKPVPAAAVTQIRGLAGVAAAEPVLTGRVSVQLPVGDLDGATAYGLGPNVLQTVRDDKLRDQLGHPQGFVFVPSPLKYHALAPKEGTLVTVAASGSTPSPPNAASHPVQLKLAYVNVPSQAVMIDEALLKQLDPSAVSRAVFIRATDDDVDGEELQRQVEKAAGSEVGGHAEGLLTIRQLVQKVIDILMLIVTCLLGVSVLIALIGIFNTMSLSVYERTHESALLRSLGLTRGQLRGTLAFEAVLFAMVGAVLGLLFGGFCAWAGVRALVGDTIPVSLTIPWWQVAAMLGVALLAGLLSSVLPAQKAAKSSPVAALQSAT